MPTKRVFKPMQLYKGFNDITPDLPLRRYKYFGSIDLSLSANPLNPILKQKLLVSLKDAKQLRKLKVDEDAYIENKQTFEPYRKIALRHSQTLSSFSNYLLRDDTRRPATKILKIVGKLKSMSRYKSFALSFRELKIAQRSLKSLDLMSSKFIKTDFKKLLLYLLNCKFSFPWIQKLIITSRLSREKENIVDLLPSILDCPKFKEIGLGFLYAKELPEYKDLPIASRRKVKDLVLLTDDGYNVTSLLPTIAAFDGLKTLSISNPFRGFKVDESSCKDWKIIEKLPNLHTFSLELTNDKNPERFGLLLSSLRWPRQLENLTLLFHSIPLEGLMKDYPMHLVKFMRTLSKLGNLSLLNLKFESENLRDLPEVVNMLCTALTRQEKLKEVYLAFPEPRYRTSSIKNHSVLNIGKLFSALNRSAKTLTKLSIVGVKGELSELENPVSFRTLQEVSISLDEKMDTSNQLDALFNLLGAYNLKKLELNFRTPAITQDILSLERLKNVEYLKVSVLGEMIAGYIMILKAVLLNSQSLQEVWLDFPDLDVREENRIRDMLGALKTKKKIRKIKIGTKYLKYSFDRNVDSNMKEQASNEHRTMMRFVL